MGDEEEQLLGVDTGGTFTDVMYRRGGELVVHKLLSTPDDPSIAIGEGYRTAHEAAMESSGDELPPPPVVHGTTVATNALLERDTAEVAFLVTSGFEDLLELRRQNRPELYDLEIDRPAPVVDRAHVIGVPERIDATGDVLRALGDADIERLLGELEQLTESASIRSVAICLLHAYADPRHERRLAEAIRDDDRFEHHVSASHDVVGEFREYERASTTCVNAAVAPVMEEYLGRLRSRLPTEQIDILQSSGGRVDVERASGYPVETVLSGPAGGVVGAFSAANRLGEPRMLSLDMGGTSTDVSFCDGELSMSDETEIDGLPIHSPVIDIHTVGAGGGSIARADAGGGLRVGPQSAGADPGPACYGRGGTEPTVTDAHVVLGRIQPGHFLGGEMSLDVEAAHRAVDRLADDIEMSTEEAALGVLRVAEASMTRALKVMSIERGEDPRDMALVAFGGAGALHACRLAENLEIPTVIVPRNPGVLSAYGMLHADYQRLVRQSLLRPLTALLERPSELVEHIRRMIQRTIQSSPHTRSAFTFELDAALRYDGQSYEIQVPVDWAETIGDSSDVASRASVELSDPSEAFEQRHEQLYGHRADRDIELVGLRLRAVVPGAEPIEYEQMTAGEDDTQPRNRREESVVFRDGEVTTDIIDRRCLEDGDHIRGAAIVTEFSGTTVIPPGWSARVDGGAIIGSR